MKRLLIIVALLFLATTGARAAGIWASYPTSGTTPFAHAWNHGASWCGQPTGPRWVGRYGVWHQPFQHCTMREAAVSVAPRVTNTALPTPTIAPKPTATALPPPTPTSTPHPTATPAPIAASGVQLVVDLINGERAQVGVAPLSLDAPMSAGTATCMGAQGHAESMMAKGAIGHWDFPVDLCGAYMTGGENVGASGGSVDGAIRWIHNAMMSEQHDIAYCALYNNHACNILNPSFTRLGVGLATNGTTYLSEDFEG